MHAADPRSLVGRFLFWAFWGWGAYSTASFLFAMKSASLAAWVLGALAFLVLFVWTLGAGRPRPY